MKMKERFPKVFRVFLMIILSLIVISNLSWGQEKKKSQVPPTLLPEELINDIINEVSGDIALQNEIILTGVNRNRKHEEYTNHYFESEFILKKLHAYGIRESYIVELPDFFSTGEKKTWDAESAELWMIEPEKKKLIDLNDVPACLTSGSVTSDVTTELVYVGPGDKESYYEGKDVKDKIVLVNGYPGGAKFFAVDKFGAFGIVAYSSSHPEFDSDQVGWSGIGGRRTARPDEKVQPKDTFAFMVSTRMGNELRNMIERGVKVKLRALCKTDVVPYHDEGVVALIKGSEYPDEELVFTAHLFEGYAKQGANDNASGCVAILETARTIQKLINDGKIKPLKRSIRFLFIPEISGTIAYLNKYPEIKKKMYASINEDMVGEALHKNYAFFSIKKTPYSIPSYLNDVLENIIEWVGMTNRITIEYRGDGYAKMLKPIISPTGSRDPFYYKIDRYYGASDHIVFVDGGIRIPGVMLIAWPDMWYHTSGDTPDKSDSTQLKRVAYIGVTAALFLSNASDAEVLKMIEEVYGRALSRIGEETRRAFGLLNNSKPDELFLFHKEADNILRQAIIRESEALNSISFFIKGKNDLNLYLNRKVESLKTKGLSLNNELKNHYELLGKLRKVEIKKLSLSPEERRLSKIVPIRTEKMQGFFNFFTFREQLKDKKDLPKYNLGVAEFEVRNFIDGKRSILDIRNAVSAEYDPVDLKDVENYIKVLEIAGMVKLENR